MHHLTSTLTALLVDPTLPPGVHETVIRIAAACRDDAQDEIGSFLDVAEAMEQALSGLLIKFLQAVRDGLVISINPDNPGTGGITIGDRMAAPAMRLARIEAVDRGLVKPWVGQRLELTDAGLAELEAGSGVETK